MTTGEIDAVSERIASDLATVGFSVCPSFLRDETVAALRAEVLALWQGGALREARIGSGQERRRHAEVRSDWISWLDPASLSPAGRELWAAIERLRLAINRHTMLGLFEFEAHLALYPPGAFYARHLDQFRGTADRVVSCIVYLNDAWKPEHGGELCLFVPDGRGGERPQEVLPAGGTLACFLSGDLWHEVRPATRERLSITGWLRKRP